MLPAASAVSAYRHILRRRAGLIALLLAAIFIALLIDFTVGPSGLPWRDLWRTLSAPASADPTYRVIVWDIRLPSALMAALVGMALGLAGAEMQTILNNPLASPFTLGVSSAAAFGASLAIVLQLGLPGVPAGWLIAGNAFLFAVLAALLLDAVARWSGMNTSDVVLFGIAMVFTFNSLVSLVQFLASAEALQNLVFWTMGSLSRSSWTTVGVLALAVAFVGTIGFIGLVAPHIARRLFGEDHRFYLPGSALVGALILSLASVVSKNLMPGVVVPVGIVTALVGIPFFVSVVLRRQLP